MSALGPNHQRGASLLVALIFLVVMAMLGVTVANNTMLQERMAGHTRDRELALQAAEAALQAAAVRLEDATFRAGVIEVDETNANDADFWETCFVGSSTAPVCAVKYTPALPFETEGATAVAAQPQYVVEKRNVLGVDVFRVTARAVGGTAEAIVVLQAEYEI